MSLDRKECIGILSTDMTKAFDSVHPSLMLNKLKAYKFSDRALELIRSYFQDRLNRAKLQDSYSEWKASTRGCPQDLRLAHCYGTYIKTAWHMWLREPNFQYMPMITKNIHLREFN